MRNIRLILPGIVVLAALAAGMHADAKGFSGADQKFFREAATGGMMEVRLGETAAQKAQSQDVREFGQRMVKDHTAANDELKRVAQQNNQAMPDKLEPKQQQTVDKLSKLSGQDFDKRYMFEMVKEHTSDVHAFQDAIPKLKNADLKNWAEKTLPVLEEHLSLAKQTAQKNGVDAGKAEQQGIKKARKHR